MIYILVEELSFVFIFTHLKYHFSIKKKLLHLGLCELFFLF